jgi:hypothetical protein
MYKNMNLRKIKKLCVLQLVNCCRKHLTLHSNPPYYIRVVKQEYNIVCNYTTELLLASEHVDERRKDNTATGSIADTSY